MAYVDDVNVGSMLQILSSFEAQDLWHGSDSLSSAVRGAGNRHFVMLWERSRGAEMGKCEIWGICVYSKWLMLSNDARH